MTTETPHPMTSSHLVPTSSHDPGRPQKSTSSHRPPPYGDEVELESNKDHPTNNQIVPNNGTSSTTPTTTHQEHRR